jgi:hypothetical protein
MAPHRRRRMMVLVGSMLAVALVSAQPAGASATGDGPVLVNCVGANYQHFEPGLTFEPQHVTMSGRDEATTCLSLTHPHLHSFIGPFSGTGDFSCTSLFVGGGGTQQIYWNGLDGPAYTSVWQFTFTYNNVNGNNVGLATGPIISGPLAGATLTQTITVPQTNLLACFTPQGMTDNNGPSTWVFTNL